MGFALRTALIWHDEVMDDLVFDRPKRITLGHGGGTTFTVPDLGLPPGFAIVRPGQRGYLLTLGAAMRGTICIDGAERDVGELVGASGDGFAALSIGDRDWGVIELDASGHHKLFFQFVAAEEPVQFFTRSVVTAGAIGHAISSAALALLWYGRGIPLGDALLRGVLIATLAMIVGGFVWSTIRKDSESMASLAFSVVLHAAILFMTYQLAEGENPFAWPGPRVLSGRYLVAQLEHDEPASGKPATGAAPATPKPSPTVAGPTGGGTPWPGNPHGEAPPTQLLTPRAREIIQGVADRDIAPALTRFMGLDGTPRTFVPPGPYLPGQHPGPPGPNNLFTPGPQVLDPGPIRHEAPPCPTCGPRHAPTLDLDPPTGDFGGFLEADIDQVVKARRGLFRMCYQRRIDKVPNLAGKVVVRFKIGGDGIVAPEHTATTDASTLHDAEVEQCIKSNINRLHFPAKGGSASVTYPFVFSQGG